jgi:hypothetical protein
VQRTLRLGKGSGLSELKNADDAGVIWLRRVAGGKPPKPDLAVMRHSPASVADGRVVLREGARGPNGVQEEVEEEVEVGEEEEEVAVVAVSFGSGSTRMERPPTSARSSWSAVRIALGGKEHRRAALRPYTTRHSHTHTHTTSGLRPTPKLG